jgi:hypothetical protein
MTIFAGNKLKEEIETKPLYPLYAEAAMKALSSNQFPEYKMLYRFALDCVGHKYNYVCSNQCGQCASNISLYGIDKRTAVMIQHSANLDVQRCLSFSRQIDLDLDRSRCEKKWLNIKRKF